VRYGLSRTVSFAAAALRGGWPAVLLLVSCGSEFEADRSGSGVDGGGASSGQGGQSGSAGGKGASGGSGGSSGTSGAKGGGGSGGVPGGSGGASGSSGQGGSAGTGGSGGIGGVSGSKGVGGFGGVAGTIGAGGGAGGTTCLGALPQVDGGARSCNAGTCYCPPADVCYPRATAFDCCAQRPGCYTQCGSKVCGPGQGCCQQTLSCYAEGCLSCCMP
jgi:hypothetical protein